MYKIDMWTGERGEETSHTVTLGTQREKEGDLTQSYDKTLLFQQNSKTKGQHTNATKNIDYTTIADRLRTVSWSNKSSNWCG